MTKGKPQKKTEEQKIEVLRVTRGEFTVCVLGRTPLIYNCVSQKAQRELLLPGPKKNAAAKAASLKHFPLEEYRSSTYRSLDPDAPTRLVFPATAFKAAMCDVALDMEGAAKTQIGRLTYVTGDYISIYGVPQIGMDVVRNSDMNRTPDIRTRAKLPQWACLVTVQYIKPLMTEQAVANLLAAAGIMRGIGDWRQQKGKGHYGQWELVAQDHPLFVDLLQHGGREAQDAALEDPAAYDQQTLEMLEWYEGEVKSRGRDTKSGVAVKVEG